MRRFAPSAALAALLLTACSGADRQPTDAPRKTTSEPAPTTVNPKPAPQMPVDRAVAAVDALIEVGQQTAGSSQRLIAELVELSTQVKEARLSFTEALEAGEGPEADRARRRALFELRAVPLTLSIVLTEIGLEALHDNLPDHVSDELSTLVHRARAEWLSLADLLAASPAT